MMDMMKMYFHSGLGDTLLFRNFVIDTSIKMITTCGVLFLLAILQEAIKYMRCVSCGCHNKDKHYARDSGDQDNDDTNIRPTSNCYVARLRTRRHRLTQTVLHAMQITIGYILMLTAMSFNLCLIFAIIVGKLSRRVS